MDKYWSDAPSWAKYLVVNYNYHIGYHELKHFLKNGVWVSWGKWQDGGMPDFTKTLAEL